MKIAQIGPAALPVGHSLGGAVERRMVELAAAQLHRGEDIFRYAYGMYRSREAAREIRSTICGDNRRQLNQAENRAYRVLIKFYGDYLGQFATV